VELFFSKKTQARLKISASQLISNMICMTTTKQQKDWAIKTSFGLWKILFQ